MQFHGENKNQIFNQYLNRQAVYKIAEKSFNNYLYIYYLIFLESKTCKSKNQKTDTETSKSLLENCNETKECLDNHLLENLLPYDSGVLSTSLEADQTDRTLTSE